LIRHAQFEHWVPFPLERVFLFFANPENLPRLMPPETGTRIDKLELVPPLTPPELPHPGPLAGVGSEICTSFRVFPGLPLRARWIARITEFEWDHHFTDIQAKGPFHTWHHRHEFSSELRAGIPGTLVRDQIDYSVGFGPLGTIVGRVFVARQLEKTFLCRQEALPGLLS
jgi:ligand-binding SRPBCC domain-containing protein